MNKFETVERIRNGLWFGTAEKMQWFQTPLAGADTGSQNWGNDGVSLNGHGYSFSSFGSHRVYNYEWSQASARSVAATMKSYADGSYGRGLIYFVDPLTYDTNVLPASWADPSMASEFEGATHVEGLNAHRSSGFGARNSPMYGAYYEFGATPVGFRGKSQAVFIPVPEGYTLGLGAFYAVLGTATAGGVYVSPQSLSGAIGAPVRLTALAQNHSGSIVPDRFDGIAGVWLWVGRTATTATGINLGGMVARLAVNDGTGDPFADTNPNWVGGEGHAGCRFVGRPTRVENGPDYIGFAVTLKEVIN